MLYYDKLSREVVDDPNKVNIDQRSMETLVENYKDKLDNKEGVLIYDEDINSLVYKEYIVLLGVNKNAPESWTRLNEAEESEYYTTVNIKITEFNKYDEIRKDRNKIVTYKLDEGFRIFDVPEGCIYDNKTHSVIKFIPPFRKINLDTTSVENVIMYDGILFEYDNKTYKLPFRVEDQIYFNNLMTVLNTDSSAVHSTKLYNNLPIRNSDEYIMIDATVEFCANVLNEMLKWRNKLKAEVANYVIEYDSVSIENEDILTLMSKPANYIKTIQTRINENK